MSLVGSTRMTDIVDEDAVPAVGLIPERQTVDTERVAIAFQASVSCGRGGSKGHPSAAATCPLVHGDSSLQVRLDFIGRAELRVQRGRSRHGSPDLGSLGAPRSRCVPFT